MCYIISASSVLVSTWNRLICVKHLQQCQSQNKQSSTLCFWPYKRPMLPPQFYKCRTELSKFFSVNSLTRDLAFIFHHQILFCQTQDFTYTLACNLLKFWVIRDSTFKRYKFIKGPSDKRFWKPESASVAISSLDILRTSHKQYPLWHKFLYIGDEL